MYSSRFGLSDGIVGIPIRVFRHCIAIGVFASCVAVVSIIFWEKISIESGGQHGSASNSIVLDPALSDSSGRGLLSFGGGVWRYDTSQRIDVDAREGRWYHRIYPIGVEITTSHEEYVNHYDLPYRVMDDVRTQKPEALYVGHQFVYKNGLIGVRLSYDAYHNGERQRYVGEYFFTPTHYIRFVVFVSRAQYTTYADHINNIFLGFFPQWSLDDSMDTATQLDHQ